MSADFFCLTWDEGSSELHKLSLAQCGILKGVGLFVHDGGS
jgi:hypothetical protein